VVLCIHTSALHSACSVGGSSVTWRSKHELGGHGHGLGHDRPSATEHRVGGGFPSLRLCVEIRFSGPQEMWRQSVPFDSSSPSMPSHSVTSFSTSC